MNRFTTQLLHTARPAQLRVLLDHSLQFAQPMRQTQLPVLGGRQKLRAIAAADPPFGAVTAHQLADDFRAPRRRTGVGNARDTPKDPLPPVPPADARTGLIAADD